MRFAVNKFIVKYYFLVSLNFQTTKNLLVLLFYLMEVMKRYFVCLTTFRTSKTFGQFI